MFSHDPTAARVAVKSGFGQNIDVELSLGKVMRHQQSGCLL